MSDGPGFSPGGFASEPTKVELRRLGDCVCGRPIFRIGDGPPEHIIPARAANPSAYMHEVALREEWRP